MILMTQIVNFLDIASIYIGFWDEIKTRSIATILKVQVIMDSFLGLVTLIKLTGNHLVFNCITF